MFDLLNSSDQTELHELTASLRKFVERFPIRGSKEYHRKDFESMAALGLCGLPLPEEVGGLSLPPLYEAVCMFELAKRDLGAAIYLSVHLMASKLIASKPTTHVDLLQQLASGAKLAAFCLTEAESGSDASQLSTKAVLDGETWVLNGEKVYITMGGYADIYLVFARTADSGSKGISAFIVPKETDGISFGTPEAKMGCEGSPISSVHFSDCRIPASYIMGETNEGYKIALSGLAGGRINIAAAACGLAAEALRSAITYTSERKQFGQRIVDFQGIQFMLADLGMTLRAALLLTRDAASPPKSPVEPWRASMAKCFATDAAMTITTDCVQLFGGAGYLKDYRVEQLMRDAKMLQIVEGTNQIQRLLIARSLKS